MPLKNALPKSTSSMRPNPPSRNKGMQRPCLSGKIIVIASAVATYEITSSSQPSLAESLIMHNARPEMQNAGTSRSETELLSLSVERAWIDPKGPSRVFATEGGGEYASDVLDFQLFE